MKKQKKLQKKLKKKKQLEKVLKKLEVRHFEVSENLKNFANILEESRQKHEQMASLIACIRLELQERDLIGKHAKDTEAALS